MSKLLILGVFLVVLFGVYQFIVKPSVTPQVAINTQSSPSPTITSTISPTATTKPSLFPIAKTTPTPKKVETASGGTTVLSDVPFTSQAPFGEWSDPKQEDACEEASVIMAMHWVKNEPIASKQAAKDEILAVSQYEQDTYGDYHDTSAQDTVDRLFKGYFHYNNVELLQAGSAQDLINQLNQGRILIIPANGRAMGQPNFTQPGPERHMLVIKGFDPATNQFISNDPGIKQGENWKYPKDTLFNAIRNYTSGFHAPIVGNEKLIIVVKK